MVILTGEALRRRNAEAIAGVLAERGGELVTATAGHHMEAMLAAYGSGAARVSYDTGQRILNVDIGGGTTKLAVLDHGRVVATAAVHVGGRLQVVDDAGPDRAARARRRASTRPGPATSGRSATSPTRTRTSSRSPRGWPTCWWRPSPGTRCPSGPPPCYLTEPLGDARRTSTA